MRMTDYVNRYCYEAFVGEETLAKDCNVTPRSIRRAKVAAIKHDILECTQKGNQYVGASRYVFKLSEVQRTSVSHALWKMQRTLLTVQRTLWVSAEDT